ncbi:hypothetical protein EJ02DRAFT_53657 [Clathrospora elynae]|uniref:Uncharacterized protein n=1 Tax=Clathrospora elynae TaxID=706981 RepID=A0A6A5SZM4_9PLEO|nr:hypothetical protein EJ02DRAFT_53657 [Clathrospora elynae]
MCARKPEASRPRRQHPQTSCLLSKTDQKSIVGPQDQHSLFFRSSMRLTGTCWRCVGTVMMVYGSIYSARAVWNSKPRARTAVPNSDILR